MWTELGLIYGPGRGGTSPTEYNMASETNGTKSHSESDEAISFRGK
jgi:hypothetical protein